MSGTRFTKKNVIDTAISHIGGFAVTLTTDLALQQHAADFAGKLAEQAENFIPCASFMARLSVQTFNALLAVRDDVEFNAKALAKHVAYDLVGATASVASYNGINMLAGRDLSEIHPAEYAAWKTTTSSFFANATRFGMGFMSCKKKGGPLDGEFARLEDNAADMENQSGRVSLSN